MEVVRLRGVEHLDKLLTTAVDDFVEAFVCKATVVCVADGSIMNWGSVKPLSEESYSLSLALVMVEWPSSSGKGARPTEDELPPPWTLNLHEGPLPSPMVFRGAGLSTVPWKGKGQCLSSCVPIWAFALWTEAFLFSISAFNRGFLINWFFFIKDLKWPLKAKPWMKWRPLKFKALKNWIYLPVD